MSSKIITKKINKHVSVIVYKQKNEKTVIEIKNNKEFEQVIYLYEETLKKIANKVVDLV